MSFDSFLTVRLHPGKRDQAIAAFVQARILELCADHHAGFIRGVILVSATDPDIACIKASWDQSSSYQDWVSNSAREGDGSGAIDRFITGYIDYEPGINVVVHTFERPGSVSTSRTIHA